MGETLAHPAPLATLLNRGGVEDKRLEAKAKDTKKIRGQGQGHPFRGQALSRPRTEMLEAKAKDQGQKKKRSSLKFFRRSQKKKVFTKIFQAISTKNVFQKIFQALDKILSIAVLEHKDVLEDSTSATEYD